MAKAINITDDELWFEHDTLHFGPSSPWVDGNTRELSFGSCL
jgi:hypothetical protein